MAKDFPLQKLHVRLLKPSVRRVDEALENSQKVNRYEIRSGLGFDGRLYIAPPKQKSPSWFTFVKTGIVEQIRELTNRSNAAILVIRRNNRIFAFTFGHGRHLIRPSALVADFGLKTALNALQYDSLLSLDSFVIEEQTVHTRAQASRAAGIETFGLDVSRDILRAVTGTPRIDVPLRGISGSETTLAISVHTDFPGLGALCDLLLKLYRKNVYKEHFAWVDNIRRVSDPLTLETLNSKLVQKLHGDSGAKLYLAPPEPIEWERIDGFTYTRRRKPIDHEIKLTNYLENTDPKEITIENLRKDKVFVFKDGDDARPSESWSVFNCLVFETSAGNSTYVLTTGTWFEIDRDFSQRIQRTLSNIPKSEVNLPIVKMIEDNKLEAEPDYNVRVSLEAPKVALLDRKTGRCHSTSTGVELCDLMTDNLDLIHVKHKKGGSSSLSHLFAQARISAEALISDEDFRKDLRQHLKDIKSSWEKRIPVTKPDPRNYNVVFAILGTRQSHPGSELPFFSQLNLARTYESLTSLGFKVSIIGVASDRR